MSWAPLVGIDVVEPDRVREKLAARPALRHRLFTADELRYCDAQPVPSQHLAARFCAKEAVTKALGMDTFHPRDVELLRGGTAPAVRLHGSVLGRARELGVTVTVSVSHVKGLAVAVALASHGS